MNIPACKPKSQPRKTIAPESKPTLRLTIEMQSQRLLLVGQLRLLLLRAERGLRIDKRSVINLVRVYVTLLWLGAA